MVSRAPEQPSPQALLEKMLQLPPDKLIEVEDFIDFLLTRTQDHQRDRQLVTAAAKLSENAFQAVWDNSDDAKYDQL